MSFKSAEGSKFINDLSFVNYPIAQGVVSFPDGASVDGLDVITGITFPDASIQTTAFVAYPPYEYQQPAIPNTASGTTDNIYFANQPAVGGVYIASVELECIPNNVADCIVDYLAELKYNGVIISTAQQKISVSGGGVVNGFQNVSIPLTGFFTGVAGQLVEVSLTCSLVKIADGSAPTSGWKTNTDSYLNLLRIH